MSSGTFVRISACVSCSVLLSLCAHPLLAFDADGQPSASKQADVLKGHAGTVFSVRFSPAGRMPASGSGDMTLKLWRVATHELDRTHRVCLFGGVFPRREDSGQRECRSNDSTVGRCDRSITRDARRTCRRRSLGRLLSRRKDAGLGRW